MGKRKYTDEHDGFLRENREKYTLKELTNAFNEHFNLNMSEKGIEFRCQSVIKKTVMKIHKYTETERTFLCNHREFNSCKNLTKMFNENFNADLKIAAISRYCYKNFGKNKKQLPGFKKGNNLGHFSSKVYPIGSEKINDLNGYTLVKTNNGWKLKHHIVWEEKNGIIPDGCIVYFLDGDKTNFDISNLYCTDRKIMTTMVGNKFYSNNPEQTLTAIKYCELFHALKESKEKT